VGLIARGSEGLDAAAAEVRGEGARAAVVSADVADAEALDRAVQIKLLEELGGRPLNYAVFMTYCFRIWRAITCTTR
jgi:hypothetical protein